MTNPVTETSVTGILQDLGETCTSAMWDFQNSKLFFREDNIDDWRSLHGDMQAVLEKLTHMIERSKEADPVPPEYVPIYGVQSRGKIVA